MYSCRQAAELASRAMEEPLPALDRARLRMHQMMCSGCRNFSRQMSFLRRISRKIPEALNPDKDLFK